MDKYHKIQTVFHRDPNTKFKTLIWGKYSKPEFECLKNAEWSFTEKVDGTNIRIMFDGEKIHIGGRTDNAQIPVFLYDKLQSIFNEEFFANENFEDMIFYGEGYGNKIQKGGGDYISDGVDFILFDIKKGDNYFNRDVVDGIAESKGLKSVPVLGYGSLDDALDLVKEGFDSTLKESPPEGLVLRPTVDLKNNKGERIITKIKLKDFR